MLCGTVPHSLPPQFRPPVSRAVDAANSAQQSVPADAPRAFISYSHDSPAHRRRVLDLALRLRAEGVDCEVDQFHETDPPPEGWPAWMDRQIRDADYILVVCTELYHRRVAGREAEGVGLGARWEGQRITQALYDVGGRNDKFVPVVFDPADLDQRPSFLRPTTYYDLSKPAAYDDLYWRLTRQPGVVKPPLGVRRRRPHDASGDQVTSTPQPRPTTPGTTAHVSHPKQPLALLVDASGREAFIPLLSAEEADDTTLVLRPDNGDARAFLDALRGNRFGSVSVAVAYRLTAYRAQLTSVVRAVGGGEDRYTLKLTPDRDRGQGIMEMATTGYSADDLAELRARRILLGEKLPTARGRGAEMMFESFVAGLNTGFRVGESPLPALYARLGRGDPAQFVAAAELLAVLWLRLSGTVAHVLELEMRLTRPATLGVHFVGQRGQPYANRDPVRLTIDGECALDAR